MQASPAGGGKGHGYFVLSESKWNGSLGNLAGADTKCLTELQTRSWVGKADAQARGILTGAKVKAFLCNSTTCNNLEPNTTYFYARANYSIDGHSGFTTDANGAGPGSSGDYYWDDEWVFGVNDEYWSNRAVGTSARWGTTPRFATSARTCTDYTSASASLRGRTGRTGSLNAGRWDLYDEYCDVVTYGRLVCYVNP